MALLVLRSRNFTAPPRNGHRHPTVLSSQCTRVREGKVLPFPSPHGLALFWIDLRLGHFKPALPGNLKGNFFSVTFCVNG